MLLKIISELLSKILFRSFKAHKTPFINISIIWYYFISIWEFLEFNDGLSLILIRNLNKIEILNRPELLLMQFYLFQLVLKCGVELNVLIQIAQNHGKIETDFLKLILKAILISFVRFVIYNPVFQSGHFFHLLLKQIYFGLIFLLGFQKNQHLQLIHQNFQIEALLTFL